MAEASQAFTRIFVSCVIKHVKRGGGRVADFAQRDLRKLIAASFASAQSDDEGFDAASARQLGESLGEAIAEELAEKVEKGHRPVIRRPTIRRILDRIGPVWPFL